MSGRLDGRMCRVGHPATEATQWRAYVQYYRRCTGGLDLLQLFLEKFRKILRALFPVNRTSLGAQPFNPSKRRLHVHAWCCIVVCGIPLDPRQHAQRQIPQKCAFNRGGGRVLTATQPPLPATPSAVDIAVGGRGWSPTTPSTVLNREPATSVAAGVYMAPASNIASYRR